MLTIRPFDFSPQDYRAVTAIHNAIYKLVFDSPYFRAERLFVAVDGERVVALTELPLKPADTETLHTGFTGVVRAPAPRTRDRIKGRGTHRGQTAGDHARLHRQRGTQSHVPDQPSPGVSADNCHLCL